MIHVETRVCEFSACCHSREVNLILFYGYPQPVSNIPVVFNIILDRMRPPIVESELVLFVQDGAPQAHDALAAEGLELDCPRFNSQSFLIYD